MALANATSIFSTVFMNYTNYVFGENTITALMIMTLFIIIGALIKLPLAINLSIYIPITIILMALGVLPIIAGATMVILLMTLAGISFVNSL